MLNPIRSFDHCCNYPVKIWMFYSHFSSSWYFLLVMKLRLAEKDKTNDLSLIILLIWKITGRTNILAFTNLFCNAHKQYWIKFLLSYSCRRNLVRFLGFGQSYICLIKQAKCSVGTRSLLKYILSCAISFICKFM